MNKITSKGTVAVRRQKEKELILEQLRRVPVIQVACERAGLSRASFYRLKAEDEAFKTLIEEAIKEGVGFINDMGESQLIALIREKNWPAISFWLRAHHPSYKQRDFQAGIAVIDNGDRTIFEIFADINPETIELRDSYLQKINKQNDDTKE